MTYQNITFEHAEGGAVGVLTVNRPPTLNALNASTLEEIAHALARVGQDLAVRVLLVTGAGDKAFVAGADIAAMRNMSALEAQQFSALGQRVMQAIEALPVPGYRTGQRIRTGRRLRTCPELRLDHRVRARSVRSA